MFGRNLCSKYVNKCPDILQYHTMIKVTISQLNFQAHTGIGQQTIINQSYPQL